MIKKLTLGLTVLLSGLATQSLVASVKSPVDLNVPCFYGGFTFGLAGLYLKPSTSALDYALVYPSNAGQVIVPNGTVKSVKPDYDWGYQLSVGYLIPGTGNDVSLGYTSFESKNKNSVSPKNNEVIFGAIRPFVGFNGITPNIADSSAKAEFNYQAIDLDLGQHINVGCNAHLRFLSGLRYADLDSKLGVNYVSAVHADSKPAEKTTITTDQKSEFKGIGPRFGVDMNYTIGSGFGIVGQTTGALLIGDINSTYNEHDLSKIDDTVTESVNSYRYPDVTRVVPNLTAKLGLNYNYTFCNPSHTQLTLEAGYQVDHYFNTIDRLNSLDTVGTVHRQTIDTSFAGPYAGIQLRI